MIIIKDNSVDRQIKDVDSEKGIVSIYVNAYGNVDSDNDVSVKGSFKKTIKEHQKRIKHFLNHSFDKLIGVPIEMKEDDFGLLVRSQLNLKTQIGNDAFENYKLYAEHDKSLEHSVGLDAIKSHVDKQDGKDVRMVTEWKLWEYSTLYGWGANENTPLVGLKNMKLSDTLETLDLMLKKGKFSDEMFIQIETKYNELKALVTNEPFINTQEPEPLKFDEARKLFKF